ncbi:MAG TPA: TPM domain-containing protein [Bacteroidia bacterium]|jgi:uncharacterized membrane protein|nr:TPM domain-containing protein [Bacteroidia bacterium]
MSKSARDFFSKEEVDLIVNTIAAAEKLTSGEIRLHVEDSCKKNVLKRAEEIFVKHKMHKTAERNGVLFYLAVKTKDFAIAGDSGIHEKVSQAFWDNINKLVLEHFKEGKFTEGLCKGIALCGEQLQKYFPHKANDKNELSNEVSFSK